MAKVEYSFDPFKGVGRPGRGKVAAAKREIADYVLEQLLDHIGDARSPVEGGPWKADLTPEYAERKSEESSAVFANLELTGELLDSLKVKNDGKNLKITVEGGSRLRGKAEGNNIGSYGKGRGNRSKARRFVPLRSEKLNREIRDGIKEIAREFLQEDG